jgi:hypothetical protein
MDVFNAGLGSDTIIINASNPQSNHLSHRR